MPRRKDVVWNVGGSETENITMEGAQLAVLMDIRDELKTLNRIFGCGNFLDVPRKLDAIVKNTKKRRAKPKG